MQLINCKMSYIIGDNIVKTTELKNNDYTLNIQTNNNILSANIETNKEVKKNNRRGSLYLKQISWELVLWENQ